jgi:hypothetical protein
MLMIPSDNPEATTFLAKMIDLCQYWTSSLHSMIIYHVTDPAFANSPRVVEFDDEYDLDPGLDTSESLFRISLMSLGVFGEVSEDVQTCLWSGLWRALRYDSIVATFDSLLAEAETWLESPTQQKADHDLRRLADAALKRKQIAFY